MPTLVDSSVWIDYFRGGGEVDELDFYIDENLVVVNDLILAELVPHLKLQKQRKLIGLLHSVFQLEMRIDWEQIGKFQYQCLKQGINGIGIPDLLIAQNAIQNQCEIFSLDHHFKLMEQVLPLSLSN